jgi:hypothetical protein
MAIKLYSAIETADHLRMSVASVWKHWMNWGLVSMSTGKLLFTEENIIEVIWRHRMTSPEDAATLADMPLTMPVLLRQTEAACLLRVSVRQLQFCRAKGELMIVHLLPNQPLYVESDIDAFLMGKRGHQCLD